MLLNFTNKVNIQFHQKKLQLKEVQTMETIYSLFRKIIFANELDSNTKFIYRFSDPDGIRSGKSGWSFGVCQFDTKNNDAALRCLSDCGFTPTEIKGIVNQTIEDVKQFSPRLAAKADIIAIYDEKQLAYCVDKAKNFNTKYGIKVADDAALLAEADYVNQYGSQGEGSAAYYKKLNRPITAKDVLNFKLTQTKYGKEHPSDCKRRYNNLVAVMSKKVD